MSKKKDKKGLPWFVWALLATVVWGLYWVLFTDEGVRIRGSLFASDPGASSSIFNPSAEIAAGFKRSFEDFSTALGAERPIVLTIERTTEQYEIRKEPYRPGSGKAAFLVKPNQYALFAKEGFDELVRKGLKALPLQGTNVLANGKLFDNSLTRIFTNATDRTWTVELYGVRPAGRIRLEIGAASDEIRIELPRLVPIWNHSYSFDRKTGKLFFPGIGDLLSLGRCQAGEEWRSLVPPSPEQQLCGFRLLCVTSQCAWLEVVYTDPAEGIRTRWPPADVDFAVLDNGKSLSRVKFGGGDEAVAGSSITFEEGDRLLLDLEGAFKSRDAVLFRYQDARGDPIADILCISRIR